MFYLKLPSSMVEKSSILGLSYVAVATGVILLFTEVSAFYSVLWKVFVVLYTSFNENHSM